MLEWARFAKPRYPHKDYFAYPSDRDYIKPKQILIMNKYLIILFFVTLMSCDKNKEKIGNYQYIIETSRHNTGDFDALILKYKSYYLKKNSNKLSVLVSGQKLGYETENDTLFAYGKLEIKNVNDDIKLFVKEFYINGYDKFNECDSIIREFKQTNTGEINFVKISYYYNGKIKKFEYPKSKVLPDSETPPPPPMKTPMARI